MSERINDKGKERERKGRNIIIEYENQEKRKQNI